MNFSVRHLGYLPEGAGAAATVYELAMLKEDYFPIIIERQVFTQEDLIRIIREKVHLVYGTEYYDEIKSRISCAAGNDQRCLAIYNKIMEGLC